MFEQRQEFDSFLLEPDNPRSLSRWRRTLDVDFLSS